MSDRFSPKWNQLKKPLENLITASTGFDQLLITSFLETSRSNSKVKTVEDVKKELRAIVMSPDVPWVFFDTVSQFIRKLPPATRYSVSTAVAVSTGHENEMLQPNTTGAWQIVWELDKNADNDERFVALDWYNPPEVDKVPMIPLGIVDYIAGSVSLIRCNLILPSISILLIALESALWHALELKGVTRISEKVTYKPVKWQYKKLHDKLLFSIDGSDKTLEALETILGIYPAVGYIEFRRVSTENSKAILRAEIDEKLIEFFASSHEESHETHTNKALSEGIQRARKMDILKTVPSQLDETIIQLRNNLIHLSSDGQFDPPIPSSFGGQFRLHDELRRQPQLAKNILHLIVESIKNLYTI